MTGPSEPLRCIAGASLSALPASDRLPDQPGGGVRVELLDAIAGPTEPIGQPRGQATAEVLCFGVYHHRVDLQLTDLARHLAHVFDRSFPWSATFARPSETTTSIGR